MTSDDDNHRLILEAGLEWGLSAAEATLSSIDEARPEQGIQPYLIDLDRIVAHRAASLVDEGLDVRLAALWEHSAREVIGECLAAHDAGNRAAA